MSPRRDTASTYDRGTNAGRTTTPAPTIAFSNATRFANRTKRRRDECCATEHLVVGGDGSEHEALAEGEQSQQDDVERIAPAEVAAAGQGDQQDERHDHGHDLHFGMLARVHPDVRMVDEEGDHAHRHRQLHHQDAVHLADEGHADRLLRKAEARVRKVFFGRCVVVGIHGGVGGRVLLRRRGSVGRRRRSSVGGRR